VKNEHVVGKVFFKTLPEEMITVPSCNECDSGRGDGGPRDFHLDEEYARQAFCLRADMGSHPIANELMKGKVMRSFERSPGLANTILGTTRLVQPEPVSGIVRPPRLAYAVELDRISRVISKIVRGLYYAKEISPLPKTARIDVIVDPEGELLQQCQSCFNDPVWFGLGENVFLYKAARLSATRTVWLFVFYGCFPAFAITTGADDIDDVES
jgi:hypothetical protein